MKLITCNGNLLEAVEDGNVGVNGLSLVPLKVQADGLGGCGAVDDLQSVVLPHSREDVGQSGVVEDLDNGRRLLRLLLRRNAVGSGGSVTQRRCDGSALRHLRLLFGKRTLNPAQPCHGGKGHTGKEDTAEEDSCHTQPAGNTMMGGLGGGVRLHG